MENGVYCAALLVVLLVEPTKNAAHAEAVPAYKAVQCWLNVGVAAACYASSTCYACALARGQVAGFLGTTTVARSGQYCILGLGVSWSVDGGQWWRHMAN